MPLQQLVEYYNDRFEQEHRTRFRPFALNTGKVSGLFGPIRVSSQFTPVRHLSNPSRIAGHAAVCSLTAHEFQDIHRLELDSALPQHHEQSSDCESIINLDRLTRTVHMLNYLPIVHLDGVLFLAVDPRHILGIRRDHGAYFGEVIERCGLTTDNVVISMTVGTIHARHYDRLLAGLNNYRQRGYRIGLNIDMSHLEPSVMELASNLSPDYLRIDSPRQFQDLGNLTDTVDRLTNLIDSTGARAIIRIDRKEQAFITQLVPFDLIEGGDFEDFPARKMPHETVDSVSL